jgi:sugar phosphate isomerase/epimerase
MKFCLNTRMWHDRPLPEALEAARALEIGALDLSATPDFPHLRPLEGLRGVEALKPLLEGWEVAAVTADHPDFPRAENEGGDAAIAYTVAAVKCARTLGVPVVAISLGSTEIDAWDSAWARAGSALRMVLRETSRTGVRLAVRLDLGDVLNSLRKARRLLEEIPDPRLGLALDTGFLHYLRVQLREILEAAGGRVYHVTLRDAGRNDPFRPIGAGEVSFGATFRALRDYGYEGALSLDLREAERGTAATVEQALAEAAPRLRELLESSLAERSGAGSAPHPDPPASD